MRFQQNILKYTPFILIGLLALPVKSYAYKDPNIWSKKQMQETLKREHPPIEENGKKHVQTITTQKGKKRKIIPTNAGSGYLNLNSQSNQKKARRKGGNHSHMQRLAYEAKKEEKPSNVAYKYNRYQNQAKQHKLIKLEKGKVVEYGLLDREDSISTKKVRDAAKVAYKSVEWDKDKQAKKSTKRKKNQEQILNAFSRAPLAFLNTLAKNSQQAQQPKANSKTKVDLGGVGLD